MKKNFIYNIVYQLLSFILPLITVPYVSRKLGATNVGIYSYTYSIVYYFVLIAMLGINNYGNRTVAKYRDDKEKLSSAFLSIYLMQVFTTVFMIVCYYIYIAIFDVDYKQVAIIQSIYIISCAFDVNWFFFGIEKFKLTVTRNLLIKVLSLICIFAFVRGPYDLWKYTLILAASTLVSNIFLVQYIRKYIKFTRVRLSDVVKHLKPCIILFLPVIAVSIYKIMDKTMLGILSEITEVGYYENAEKIIQVPNAIISALGTVMLPRISNMLSNNRENEVKDIIKKTMPFVMFLTLPMVCGLIAVGGDFSIIFFGQDFEKTGLLIPLLSFTVAFFAWGNVIRTQYLIPKEMDKYYIISAFLGAIVNFVFNCIFIPIWDSAGACIGTILAEFVVSAYQTYAVRKELEIFKYIKTSFQFLVKSVIMLIVVVLVGKLVKENIVLRFVVQVVVGIAVYGGLNIRYIVKDLELNKYLKKIKLGTK